jgi:general secretion pathway protein J
LKANQFAFTLIELLIAMAIFAILSAISYRTLSSVFATREALQRETTILRDRALFFSRLENDFAGLLNRPIINADGNPDKPLRMTAFVATSNDATIAFSRVGFVGTEDGNSAPQRVGYRLREGKLEMLLWDGLDQAPRATPSAYAVLRDVRAVGWRALDAAGNWQTEWPLPQAGKDDDPFPRAIEVTVTASTGEKFNRLFAMRPSGLTRRGAAP